MAASDAVEQAANGTASAGITQAAPKAGARSSNPDDGDVLYDPVADGVAAGDAAEDEQPAAAAAAHIGSSSSSDLPDGSQSSEDVGATAADSKPIGKGVKAGGASGVKAHDAGAAATEQVPGSSDGSTLSAAAGEDAKHDSSSSQPRAVQRYPDRSGPSDSSTDTVGGDGGNGTPAEADTSEVAVAAPGVQAKADPRKRSASKATGSAADKGPSAEDPNAAADMVDDQAEATEGSAAKLVGGSDGKSGNTTDSGAAADTQDSKHAAAQGTAGTAAQIEEFAEESGSSGAC